MMDRSKSTDRSSQSQLMAKTLKAPLVMDASKVILAPRNPKMDVWFHPKHEEVLQQAKSLRVMGKSDFEIEAMLQKSLDDEWNARDDHHAPEGTATEKVAQTRPPKINVDIIRNYLDHHAG